MTKRNVVLDASLPQKFIRDGLARYRIGLPVRAHANGELIYTVRVSEVLCLGLPVPLTMTLRL